MKVVLTGGPCCGKTSLINEFEKRGYNVMHEKAREIIEESETINLDYLHREIVIRQGREENGIEGLVFLDRGLVDVVGYCNFHKIKIPKELEEIELSGRYKHIFLLDRIPFVNDGLRLEKGDEEADRTHEYVANAYSKYGFSQINVPVIDLEKRADYILERINDD